ncbi:MAG TPA: CsbD family protein [Terriglobales bacterium]|nr:CsbD family protein [Terriglobales bacterium]
MDKDRIKGKAEDVAGRIKRQAGEWTGDKEAQSEGAMDQLKGKARNAMGRMKDAARDAADDTRGEDKDIDRDKDKAA